MRKINKSQLYYILLLLFMFQPVIERYIGIFKYFDEIVVVLSFIAYLRKNKLNLNKHDGRILLYFSLLCLAGILGNIISKSGQPIRAIIQDIVSNGKMIIYALSIRKMVLNDKQKIILQNRIASTVRIIFFVMFITAIFSQYVDIGMTDKVRHGIKSYKFIFNNPAGLNTYCYLFIILHSITLYKNGELRKYSTLFTLLGIIPWMLTMRSRAIAFAIIYLILYIYIVYIEKPGKVYKFRWYQIFILGLVAILLCWDAIDTYFISNDRVARYNLMHTSFLIAKDYFPIGTGFATYGTESSRVYYSSIYNIYGFMNIYGLNREHTSYITDQFWFGIIGQFGLVGVILMGLLIFQTYKDMWRIAKWKKNSQLACLTLFMTSIFASLTAGTFIQASILPSILIFYLLCNKTVG